MMAREQQRSKGYIPTLLGRTMIARQILTTNNQRLLAEEMRIAELADVMDGYAAEAVRVLAEVMHNDECDVGTRVSAARAVLSSGSDYLARRKRMINDEKVEETQKMEFDPELQIAPRIAAHEGERYDMEHGDGGEV